MHVVTLTRNATSEIIYDGTSTWAGIVHVVHRRNDDEIATCPHQHNIQVVRTV